MTLRKTSTERLRHHRMLFWSYPKYNLSISTTSSSIPCNGKSVYQAQFSSYFTWFCAEASFACSKLNFYQNVCVFLTNKKKFPFHFPANQTGSQDPKKHEQIHHSAIKSYEIEEKTYSVRKPNSRTRLVKPCVRKQDRITELRKLSEEAEESGSERGERVGNANTVKN